MLPRRALLLCRQVPPLRIRPHHRQLASSVERDARFSRLNDDDLEFFRAALGEGAVITDEFELQNYNTDWQKKYHGASRLALRPGSTAEVSAILAHCNDRRLAVTPQGGNTGLVGGATPVHDEVVVSLSRMNKVLSFDGDSGIVTAEAGVVLAALGQYLDARGHIVPLDLGAKGTCHIGGNVSTNAGGLRYVRYGSLHGSVLGLQAVLADGTVLDNLSTLRKDNTGYDLKQLFIGAEGSLGIVTAVSLLAPFKPKSVQVAMMALPSFEALLQETCQAMVRARSELLDILSAVEFLDRESMDIVTQHMPGARDPFVAVGGAPFYMLVETHGTNEEHDAAKLQSLLESLMVDELVVDATLAQSEQQAQALWLLREGVATALTKAGAVYKYDVSVPVRSMYGMVEDMRARLAEHSPAPCRVIGYGHLGDGNLHLNVSTPHWNDDVLALIEPHVFEETAKLKGSVSAEHGIGRAKSQFMHLSKTAPMISMMRRVKDVFDPHGIMNPYKVLPEQAEHTSTH